VTETIHGTTQETDVGLTGKLLAGECILGSDTCIGYGGHAYFFYSLIISLDGEVDKRFVSLDGEVGTQFVSWNGETDTPFVYWMVR